MKRIWTKPAMTFEEFCALKDIQSPYGPEFGVYRPIICQINDDKKVNLIIYRIFINNSFQGCGQTTAENWLAWSKTSEPDSGCKHVWKQTPGIFRVYEDCVKCGVKKENS